MRPWWWWGSSHLLPCHIQPANWLAFLSRACLLACLLWEGQIDPSGVPSTPLPFPNTGPKSLVIAKGHLVASGCPCSFEYPVDITVWDSRLVFSSSLLLPSESRARLFQSTIGGERGKEDEEPQNRRCLIGAWGQGCFPCRFHQRPKKKAPLYQPCPNEAGPHLCVPALERLRVFNGLLVNSMLRANQSMLTFPSN